MLSINSIPLATGVTVEYAEQGDPRGPALILLHGIADSRRIFEPLLEHLPASIRAFAVSQRGHGDATRPAHSYRPEDFAWDLAAFMDALELDAAVVAGGSSGGVIARRFAIDHPHRVRGLVLLGSPFRLRDKPSVAEMWDTVFAPLTDPVDPVMVRDFAMATVGGSVDPAIIDVIVEENLKAPALVWRETMGGLMEDTSSDDLAAITAPTLIVWGDEDPILARSDQESLVGAIPNARLLVYPGAGHGFYLENPKQVAVDVVTFMEGLAG